jgi:hypothetical protein
MADKKLNLLAVWPYDQFPYLLTGEVSHFDKNGNPYIPTFQGAFRTTCLLPLKPKGEEFRDKLRILEGKRRNELKKLNRRFQNDLDTLKSEYGVTI